MNPALLELARTAAKLLAYVAAFNIMGTLWDGARAARDRR